MTSFWRGATSATSATHFSITLLKQSKYRYIHIIYALISLLFYIDVAVVAVVAL
jgi:hypothetical protein